MPCPGQGPCGPWELNLGCCLTPSGAFPDPCLSDGGEPVPQAIVDSAVLAASQILWSLTGRQFGCCTTTVRPCRKCASECCIPGFSDDFVGGYPWYPFHQADGTWINMACPCQDSCSCTKLSEVNLPYPVCSVDQVVIDGIVVDPATYRVDGFKKLVRLGTDTWPTCNNLTLPDTEVGTWSVTVTYGTPIPELVKMAAAEFACELIKGCVGGPCKLPQRLSSITRQGISVSFLDPGEFFTQGRTGLYLADLAISTYNPRKLARRPLVYSPDTANQWRVATWQNGDAIGPSGSCG